MKNIINNYKVYMLSLLAVVIFASCDEENGRVTWDGSYVEFNSTATSNAYLRTNDGLNVPGELRVNLVAAPSSAATSVSVQIDAEQTTAIAGVHYEDLSGGSISIPAGSNIGSIPFEVIDDNIAGGEKWTLAYTITGSDTDLGANVTNVHTFEVACLLSADKTAGDWTLDMQDSYGDGWNGASVTFEVDGVGTDYDLDTYTADGSTASTTITIPAGVETLKFFFNSGDWDSEITFQITAPNGVEVGSYGPSPAEGEFEVNNCLL